MSLAPELPPQTDRWTPPATGATHQIRRESMPPMRLVTSARITNRTRGVLYIANGASATADKGTAAYVVGPFDSATIALNAEGLAYYWEGLIGLDDAILTEIVDGPAVIGGSAVGRPFVPNSVDGELTAATPHNPALPSTIAIPTPPFDVVAIRVYNETFRNLFVRVTLPGPTTVVIGMLGPYRSGTFVVGNGLIAASFQGLELAYVGPGIIRWTVYDDIPPVAETELQDRFARPFTTAKAQIITSSAAHPGPANSVTNIFVGTALAPHAYALVEAQLGISVARAAAGAVTTWGIIESTLGVDGAGASQTLANVVFLNAAATFTGPFDNFKMPAPVPWYTGRNGLANTIRLRWPLALAAGNVESAWWRVVLYDLE